MLSMGVGQEACVRFYWVRVRLPHLHSPSSIAMENILRLQNPLAPGLSSTV